MTKILSFIKLLIGVSISVREFKDLLRTVAARNSHSLFEFILRKYDPSLDLDYAKLFSEKKFIYEGRGAGILKPNRILTGSNSKLFEKIFFNDSPGLNRNLKIDKIVADHLANNLIISPEIKKIIKGDKFTIVLFEFLDLNRIPEGEEYEVLKTTTFNMVRHQRESSNSDKIHYDRFLIGKKRLSESAVFSDEELKKLDAIVKSTPVFFQHFDLKEDNVFIGNVIIDWDNSGNYHLGADFGVLLLSFFVFNESHFFTSYKNEINEYYNEFELITPFDIFYLTVLIHFLNLFHGYTSEKAQYQKIQPIIEDCKIKLGDINL